MIAFHNEEEKAQSSSLFRNLKFSEIFFLLFFLLKPFYFKESGTFQISDSCIIASFGFLMLETGFTKVYNDKDKLFLCFIVFVTIINFCYYIYYREKAFLLSISYYYYIYIFLIEFRIFAGRKECITRLFYVLILSIGVLFFQNVLEFGNYEGKRYIGSFNDPNQCAFYVFSLFLLLYAMRLFLKRKIPVLIHVMVIFLIVETSSTGMAVSLILLYFTDFSIRVLKKWKGALVPLCIPFLFVLLAAGMMFYSQLDDFSFFSNDIVIDDSPFYIVNRLMGKMGLLQGNQRGNYSSIQEDRNWKLFYMYPQYIFYGAGQGYYSRFLKLTIVHEIHSTFLGLLFSYGIIPFTILCAWIYKMCKSSHFTLAFPIIAALFFESLFLVNYRQPTFWALIIFPAILTQISKDQSNEIVLGDKTTVDA